MPKKSKRIEDEIQVPNVAATAGDALARDFSQAQPADHSRAEAKLAVSGEAFTQFDSWIDGQLEQLVGRWIDVAAPSAATSRRITLTERRRHSSSEQA
jgi:hypothetical protein